jgi:hypothetical protein
MLRKPARTVEVGSKATKWTLRPRVCSTPVSGAAGGIGKGVIRIEPDRLIVVGDGAVEVALCFVRNTAVDEAGNVSGIDADRLAVVGDGAVEVALGLVRDAASHEGGGVYASRCADLIRLATGGSGILPSGEISVDLANRLASEASKTAEHVLNMCIRALDYCPPVNLEFGDFLRAIITADRDLVRDDDRGYRVAFIDAFRERGIVPYQIRRLAEDSLLWEPPPARSVRSRRTPSECAGEAPPTARRSRRS